MFKSPPEAVPPRPPALILDPVVPVLPAPSAPPLAVNVVMPEPETVLALPVEPFPPAVEPPAPPSPTVTVKVVGRAEAANVLRTYAPPPPWAAKHCVLVLLVPPPPPPPP